MKITRVLFGIHVSLFSVVWVILLGLLCFHRDTVIPLGQTLIAISLYLFYNLVLTIIFSQAWQGNKGQKLVCASIYMVFGLSFIPIVEVMTHDFIPVFDVIFFDERLTLNRKSLSYRITQGFCLTHGCAILLLLLLKARSTYHAKKTMERELYQHAQRMEAVKYTSHFLHNIFLSEFGRMLVDDKAKNKMTKIDIIQFVGYLLNLHHTGLLAEWEDELDQLKCFIRLLTVYYGPEAVHFTCNVQQGDFPAVPQGILIFPLENCLSHAVISAKCPIRYQLDVSSTGAVVRCENYWSPKNRSDSGTGLHLLKSRMALSTFQIVLNTAIWTENYQVTIHLNWSTDEKINVQNHVSG